MLHFLRRFNTVHHITRSGSCMGWVREKNHVCGNRSIYRMPISRTAIEEALTQACGCHNHRRRHGDLDES